MVIAILLQQLPVGGAPHTYNALSLVKLYGCMESQLQSIVCLKSMGCATSDRKWNSRIDIHVFPWENTRLLQSV